MIKIWLLSNFNRIKLNSWIPKSKLQNFWTKFDQIKKRSRKPILKKWTKFVNKKKVLDWKRYCEIGSWIWNKVNWNKLQLKFDTVVLIRIRIHYRMTSSIIRNCMFSYLIQYTVLFKILFWTFYSESYLKFYSEFYLDFYPKFYSQNSILRSIWTSIRSSRKSSCLVCILSIVQWIHWYFEILWFIRQWKPNIKDQQKFE